MKTMKTSTITQRLAQRQLGRIRRFLAANYGSTSELKRRFEKATGEQVARSSFTRWLATDPATVQQPALGTYLLLDRIVGQMKRERSKA